MATQTSTHEMHRDRTGFAQRILQADGLASVLVGVGLIAAAAPIARLVGLAEPALLEIAGLGCLAYAGVLFWVATRARIARGTLLAFAGGEWAWTVLSAAALLEGWPALTVEGRWIAALLAGLTALFGDLLAYAAWRADR